jgi:hypothetical protein
MSREAAVRKLAEETGVRVRPQELRISLEETLEWECDHFRAGRQHAPERAGRQSVLAAQHRTPRTAALSWRAGLFKASFFVTVDLCGTAAQSVMNFCIDP